MTSTSLTPLEKSGCASQAESDLMTLATRLAVEFLGAEADDIRVLAMPHEGSADLIHKALLRDGLVLPQGGLDDAPLRQLYRAWQAGNCQGRGLHFLRTYLQLLFPNQCAVEQLWCTEDSYPDPADDLWWMPRWGDDGLMFDGSWRYGMAIEGRTRDSTLDESGVFLSSRIRVSLNHETADTMAVISMSDVFGDLLAARFVVEVRFWISADVNVWSAVDV
jgi:hypothetical protein